jgi:error-prone DNA polymerase
MYVELHCHSAYSFLDGASLPDELAAAAVRLGYDALALTDHNALAGSMEFAQATASLGLRAIHGAEIDLADERHITLLVENTQGWRNLCRIVTRAHAEDRLPLPSRGNGISASGRSNGGRRVVRPPAVPLEFILEHAAGLVCLSGCAQRGVHDEPTLRRLLEAFGADRLRVELQRPFQRHDRALNCTLAGLATRLGVPCVATGNVHAHARTRAPLQDAFVALRHHATLDASEPERRGNFAHVLTTPAAMAARFEDHPRAVAESRALAERLTFDLTADLGYRYPGSEDEQAGRRLAELCAARFEERYPARDPKRPAAQSRLEEELRVIEALGLPGFFLLHRDLLELAREVAVQVRGPDTARALLPPGRGRGSSVSSIVCYLTGLSHIDPIRNELMLGRFLNDELTALPDIDLDFPRDVREVLIPRVHERYGSERSALVAAFPTFRTRGAIRELGKVLGLPPGELERVARGADPFGGRSGVEGDIGVALGDAQRGRAGRWAWLARLCVEAYGLPRHLSQHSGGMIVSTRPLIDCCPVLPAAMEGRQLCQWDKDSCSDAGFLKIDLLGLGMLSAVERCVETIARTRGERVDLSRIPFDDRETYSAIQEADTMGVFQIESRAQMASLRRTRPESLDDLTVQVAIVRPGPIVGGAVNPYIARRQRLREDPDYQVPYDHPSLEPVLRDTLGTIIFQDQVLEVAVAFAGFSLGEAEGLRRAMSRKRSAEAIAAYHDRFVEGAARTHGVDAATAERVYEMVQGFSGFGFPKAHGAAFGLLAYQSTWLRVHYAPEFLCGLLNEQPMGFYPSDTLAHEAQRRGIELLAPDVNASDVECTVEARPPPGSAQTRPPPDAFGSPEAGLSTGSPESGSPPGSAVSGSPPGSAVSGSPPGSAVSGSPPGSAVSPPPAVRIGLGYVNGVRADEVAALVAARREGGPFRSLADLASRAGAGRPSLEKLAWAGACDRVIGVESGQARRAALWQLGVAAPGERVPEGTQLSLPLEVAAAPALRPLEAWDAMVADYASTGMTLGAHPLALLRPGLPAGTVSCRDLGSLPHEAKVRIGGLVVARQRPGTAKGIVFLLLEDEFGTVNLIVPPPVYERHRLTVRTEPLLIAEGRLEKLPIAGGAINVMVHSIGSLDAPTPEQGAVIDLAERATAAAPLEDDDERAGAGGQAGSEQRVAVAGGGAGVAAAGGGAGLTAAGGVAGVAAVEGEEGAAAAAGGTGLADFRGVAPAVLSFASGRRR